LPYNEAFRGKYQSAVEGRLMQLSHYANYLKSVDFKSGIKSVFPESCTLDFEGIGELKGKRPVEIVRNIAGEDKDWKNFSPRRWKLYMQLELYLRNHLNNDEEVHAIIETKKLLVYQMLQRFTSRSIRSIESIQKTILSGDGDGLGQAYMPEDVVSILRDVCHCFSQLMQSGKDRVMGLYRFESRTMSFFKKERMPQSRYRYKSEGAVNQGKDADQKPVGEVLDALFDSLCLSCEKNVERKGASAHLDGVIREHAPSDGGLLDILDDPERLRKLMDAPIIKNQSFNRKKIIQLIQLSRSILSR
jgi:hypothetical protein